MNTNELTNTLSKIIELHTQMKNAYFYTPPNRANARREYEIKNSMENIFCFKGKKYRVVQKTTCSCRNVYYSMTIYENEIILHKDIRFIKKMLCSISTPTS